MGQRSDGGQKSVHCMEALWEVRASFVIGCHEAAMLWVPMALSGNDDTQWTGRVGN